MPVHVPSTIGEAVDLLADTPESTVLAGGTDVMVEVNDGRLRPNRAVVTVNRIPELRSWSHRPGDGHTPGRLTIGAAVTYTELMEEPLASLAPALAEAARTVGSPQIRNAGTLGGNLGTCSPAGDGLPVLAALDAEVSIVSSTGRRSLPVGELMLGVKRTALRRGELIVDVTIPVVEGWQGYSKVGVRNAMVIAIASACLVVDPAARQVALALGSVAPTIVRATDAESFIAAELDWSTLVVADDALDEFGARAAAATTAISDHRASAEYRRRAASVLARRLLRRALDRRLESAT